MFVIVAYEFLSHPHYEQMDLKTTLNVEKGSKCAEDGGKEKKVVVFFLKKSGQFYCSG